MKEKQTVFLRQLLQYTLHPPSGKKYISEFYQARGFISNENRLAAQYHKLYKTCKNEEYVLNAGDVRGLYAKNLAPVKSV